MESIDTTDSYALSPFGCEYLVWAVENDPHSYVVEELWEPDEELLIVARLACLFQSPGGTSGYIPNKPDAQAFLYGELLGLELASEYLTPQARADMNHSLKTVMTPDQNLWLSAAQRQYMAQIKMLSEGYAGWEKCKEYFGKLFDYWESSLTIEDSDGLMLRLGFGLVAHYMDTAQERQIESMMNDVSGMFIDDDLRRILGENS